MQEIENNPVAQALAQYSEQVQHPSLINKNKRQDAHALFQYPAMMVPDVQNTLLKFIIEAAPNLHTMLDPFVGSGTTLTAGLLNGLACAGQDINPLAVLISQVKTGLFDQIEFSEALQTLLSEVRGDVLTRIDVDFTNWGKWFTVEVAAALSRLKRAILKISSLSVRRFFWVSFAETIRWVSNDRTTTYKLHMRPIDEIQKRSMSPIDVFETVCRRNLIDLLDFQVQIKVRSPRNEHYCAGDTTLVVADTSSGISCVKSNEKVDLIVTSPPYGDNLTTITYGQHSYLQLQWIPLDDIGAGLDKTILRTTQEIDRRSLGGMRSKAHQDKIYTLSTRSPALGSTLTMLAPDSSDKYQRVSNFYVDFDRSLDHIVDTLSYGGYMLWVMGNRHVGGREVPNDKILSELLSAKGVESVINLERQIRGKRMPPRNSSAPLMTRERMMVFYKP